MDNHIKHSLDEWLRAPATYSSSSSFSNEDGGSSISSNLANWEEYVNENGTLFYAEYTGKGAKYKKGKRRHHATLESLATNFQNFKLSDIKSSEIKEIELVITSEDRYKFGRRSTPFESILGFRVCPFPDNTSCLMVSGFVPNSTIEQMNIVKEGNWFRAIDNIEIRIDNLDDVLMQFTSPTKVTLKFQGESKPSNEPSDTDEGYKRFISFENFGQKARDFVLNSETMDNPFYLIVEKLNTDSTPESIFYYPGKNYNIFQQAKGSFLTLNSILNNEFSSTPLCTTVKCENVIYFVNYKVIEDDILLFIVSSKFMNRKEAGLKANDFFMYFALHVDRDDFERLQLLCDIMKMEFLKTTNHVEYHTLLMEFPYMALPKEAQLRIYDACSEMEAMDYRIWNSAPLHSHREFFICGHALYYKSVLLSNNVTHDQLNQIQTFLRYQGIFDFITTMNCQVLVTWYPLKGSNNLYLTVCGRDNLMLAVILQIYVSSNENPEATEKVKPSLFYIEEIQDTLDHLIQSGIDSLATSWSESNKRPEVTIPQSLKVVERKLSRKKTTDEEVFNPGNSSIQSEDSYKQRSEINADSDSSDDWDEFPHSPFRPSHSNEKLTDITWKEMDHMLPMKLTAGKSNALLKYIHISNISLSSKWPESKLSLFMEKYFQFLHDIFKNTKKIRNTLQDSNMNSPSGKVLISIKEHGIVVKLKEANCLDRKLISFTGRLFQSPMREFYISHYSDCPQNLVELEYRTAALMAG